jgi:hypothetical protein
MGVILTQGTQALNRYKVAWLHVSADARAGWHKAGTVGRGKSPRSGQNPPGPRRTPGWPIWRESDSPRRERVF